MVDATHVFTKIRTKSSPIECVCGGCMKCVRQYIRRGFTGVRRYLAFLKYLIPFGWVRSGFSVLYLYGQKRFGPVPKIQFKVINQGFGGDNNENVKWIFLAGGIIYYGRPWPRIHVHISGNTSRTHWNAYIFFAIPFYSVGTMWRRCNLR